MEFDMTQINYDDPAQRAMIDKMMEGLGSMIAPAMPAPEYENVTSEDIRIPMRDGVQLAAVLIRPNAEGTFPVILVHNPPPPDGNVPPVPEGNPGKEPFPDRSLEP